MSEYYHRNYLELRSLGDAFGEIFFPIYTIALIFAVYGSIETALHLTFGSLFLFLFFIAPKTEFAYGIVKILGFCTGGGAATLTIVCMKSFLIVK